MYLPIQCFVFNQRSAVLIEQSPRVARCGNVCSLGTAIRHMGLEHASREKKLSMVNFLIFVQKNVSRIRFQEIKIRPLKGFEKMRFLCFYIIGV